MRLSALLRGVLAPAVLLGLGACVAGPSSSYEETSSVYGSYLAARYAGRARDLDSSSALYADALLLAPDSQLLSDRSFFAALIAGDFERADAAVQVMPADAGSAQIAHLYQRAMYLDRRGSASSTVEPIGAFSELVTQIFEDWEQVADGQNQLARLSSISLNASPVLEPHMLPHQALMLEEAGLHDEAESHYRAAIENLPSLRRYLTLLYGAFLERQRRSEAATRLYQSALEMVDPESPELRAALARIQAGGRAPRFPAPRQAAAQALYPTASIITNRAAVEYTILFLRVIERLDPEFDNNIFAIAQLLESLELNEAALNAYDRIGDSPLSDRVAVQRLWLAYRMDQDPALIDEARTLMAQSDGAGARALLADMLRFSGNCAEAAPLYASVTEAAEAAGEPGNWRYVFYQAACIEIDQGWDAAAPVFEQALSLAGEDPMVLNHVGYNLIVEGEQLERGFELVERAATLDPGNGAILDSLGWGHFKQGRLDQAILWLERAVQLSPASATNNWHLGDAYAAAGRTLEARFQWQRALELDLDDGEEDLIRRRLELGLDAGPADLP